MNNDRDERMEEIPKNSQELHEKACQNDIHQFKGKQREDILM